MGPGLSLVCAVAFGIGRGGLEDRASTMRALDHFSKYTHTQKNCKNLCYLGYGRSKSHVTLLGCFYTLNTGIFPRPWMRLVVFVCVFLHVLCADALSSYHWVHKTTLVKYQCASRDKFGNMALIAEVWSSLSEITY